MDENAKKLYVKIKSKDKQINNLQNKIEKCHHILLWLSKSEVTYRLFMERRASYGFDDNKKSGESLPSGLEELESLYMASMLHFHRCFVESKGFRLNIKDVTKDEYLRNIFDKIAQIRNDEFVHWKDLFSKIEAFYKLEFFDGNQVKFGQDRHIKLKAKLPFYNDKDFLLIIEYCRHYTTTKLEQWVQDLGRRLFSTEKILTESILIDKDLGELKSLFKKIAH